MFVFHFYGEVAYLTTSKWEICSTFKIAQQ